MGNVKVNEDMLVLISDLTNLEQNKLMLMATIYTRKIEELKKNKIDNLQKYLLDQIKFYKRNLAKYKNILDNYLNRYEKALNNLIEQYELEYNYLQNEIVFAQTNQKIAVANFVASKIGLDKANIDGNIALIEKSNKKIFATAQKKLNYDIVIDECIARMEKCIKNTYETVEEIFCVSNDKLIFNVGLIGKIKYSFLTTFSGKKLFHKNVMQPFEKELEDIEKTSMETVSDIKIETLQYTAQLEKIRNDINCSFNETLNKVS